MPLWAFQREGESREFDNDTSNPPASQLAGGVTGRNCISGSYFSSRCRIAVGSMMLMAATKRGPDSRWRSRPPHSQPALLAHAGFLVEPRGPRMQRDADAIQRRGQGDRLALGVAAVQQLAGIVVPHSLGDLVDQLLVDPGA